MIKYILRQVKNSKSTIFNKWLAYPVIDETVDLDGLAAHMASHNTVFSKGVIKGMLTDMVSCIKELLLEGKNVKLPDLAIFSIGIKNTKGGADTDEDFSVSKNIQSVKLRARATGELTAKSLDLDASLKKATVINGGSSSGSSGSSSSSGSNGSSSGTSETPETPETLSAPTISGNTTFSESAEVTISAADGAEIRYTLDGSTPTASSTLYSEAFTVTETTSVKAIAIKDGQTSEVASKTFVKSSGEGGMDQN